MQNVTSKATVKVAAVATGLAMATSMLLAPTASAAGLTQAQMNGIIAMLQGFGVSSATIANVEAALNGQPTSGSSTSGSTAASCNFTMSLTIGNKGADVTCLQNALIGAGYSIPAGATGYFGSQTRAAVAAWQKANGISPAVGYFGPISQSHWNLGGGSSTGSTGSTGGSTGGTVTGNGLKIALSPTSPNGTVLVAGQAIGDLGDFVFSNPTSAPINVTSLTFNRIGVSNDSTMTNVYLYHGATRITDSAGVNNSAFTFTNSAGVFTVPAGGTYTVSVRSDIDTGTSGQQIGVSLVSATSNGTLDSSVSFPIASGYQTISAASLATVDYGSNTTPSATSISPQNDYPVWQNTISVNTNPVKLESMRFTNLGSIDAANVTNLRLYVDGVQAGSAVPTLNADRTVTFDFSNNPVMLSEQSHTIKVLANITGGANRNIQFSIQRASDAMFVDSQLNQPVTPTNNGSTFSAVTAGKITINSVSTNSGVSVSLAPSSPNQSVAVGASNVNWATYDMLASGENVKVRDLYVYANTSLNNGKVMVNGVQAGSTKDIGNGTANATDFSMGSSLILPAGQTTKVSIYADAKNSSGTNLTNGSTVQVTLKSVSDNAQGQSSLNSTTVPAADTSGNSIVVSNSTLTATKYTGYGNQTVIAGANNAKLGAFTLSTGSTEGVTVNTINITFPSAVSSTITNLTLKDEATGATLGSVITTPSTSNSYAVNLDVPASSTKTIDIYGNVLSSANDGSIVASVGTGTTGTGDVTGTAADVASAVSLQTVTVGNGSLSVARGPGDPVSNNILAGASKVQVGEFDFTAQNSAYTVQNLAILVPNNVATSVTNVTLQYKDASGNTQTATAPLTVNATKAYATATFSGLTMNVPANDSANVDVYVGTPTIASGATSGAGINVKLAAGESGTTIFRAVNSAGSATSTINSGTNLAAAGTFYVRKSIPTFATLSGQGGSVTPTNPLYRFSITADPAGSIEWTKLTFNVATVTASLSNVYLVDEATGNNILDNTTSSASTTNNKITVDLTKNSTQPQYQQIAAGATKTYDLDGTVSGWTTGASLSISLAQDTGAPAANAAAASVSGNVVWSDRSSINPVHSLTTSDWTNGAYLKNFTTTSVTYSN